MYDKWKANGHWKEKADKNRMWNGIENVNDSLKNTRFFGPIFYFIFGFCHKKTKETWEESKNNKVNVTFFFFEKRNVW